MGGGNTASRSGFGRRVLRRFLLLCAACGVALALSPALLLIPATQKYIIQRIELELARGLNADVSIDAVRPSLSGRLVIEGTIVKARGAADSIRIGLIAARVHTPALLAGRLSIPRLEVSEVRASLSLDSSGNLSLRWRPPASPARASRHHPVRIGIISLADCQVSLCDERSGLSASWADLRVQVHASAPDSTTISVESSAAGLFVGAEAGRIVWSRVKFYGRLLPGRLAVDRLELSEGPSGLAVMARGEVPLDTSRAYNVDLTADAPVGALRPFHPALSRLHNRGEVQVSLKATGRMPAVVVQADMKVRGASIDSLALDSARAQLRWRSGEDMVDGVVTVATPLGCATVRGSAQLCVDSGWQIGDYRLSGQLEALDIAHAVNRFVGLSIGQGPLCDGELLVTGRSAATLPDTVRATLSSRHDSSDAQWSQARLRLDATGTAWRATLQLAGVSAEGSGAWSPTTLRGSANALIQELGVVSGWVPGKHLGGSAQVDARFAYGVRAPVRASLAIRSDTVAWSGSTFGGVRCSLDVAGDSVYLAELRATGRLLLDSLPLDDMPPFKGSVSVDVAAHGPTRALSAEVRATSGRIGYGRTVDSIRVDSMVLAIAPSYLRVRTCHLRWRGLTAQLAGDLRDDTLLAVRAEVSAGGGENSGSMAVAGSIKRERLDLRSRLEALPLASLRSFLPGRPVPEGTLSCSSSVTGSHSNPIVRLNAVSKMTFAQGFAVDVLLDGSIEDSLARIDLRLASNDPKGALQVSGGLGLIPSRGWRPDSSRSDCALAWRSDTLDCAVLTAWLPRGLRVEGAIVSSGRVWSNGRTFEVDGQAALDEGKLRLAAESLTVAGVAVSASIQGTTHRPAVAFSCTTGALAYRKVDSLLSATMWRGSIEDGVLTLDEGRMEASRQGRAHITGTMPLGKQADRATRARAEVRRLPLRALGPLLNSRDITLSGGTIEADLEVTGRSGQLNPNGTIQIRDGAMAIGTVRPAIGPFNASLLVRPDSVVVQRFEGHWGRGALTLAGAMALGHRGGAFGVRVEAGLRGGDLSYADTWEIGIDSAGLVFERDRTRSRLSGTIRTARTSYKRPIVTRDIAAHFRSTAIAGGATPDSQSGRLWLALKLETADPVLVDIGVARVRCTGQLAVGGSAARPSPTGEVRISDGTVRYLDRKFTLQRGILRQLDPTALNPTLDIQAQTSASPSAGLKSATEYTITMVVGGTMNAPILDFSSEPSLSQVDVISLLTLGRVRESDDAALALESTSDFATVVADRAKVLASQQITGFATRRIEKLLNLDEVTLEGNLFDYSGNSGPRLTLTKQVRDRLSVTYQSVLGNVESQRIKLSFRLVPKLYIEGETDARQSASLDLRTKFSF